MYNKQPNSQPFFFTGVEKPHSQDHKINPLVESRLLKLGWEDSTWHNDTTASMIYWLKKEDKNSESVRLYIYFSNSLNDDYENEDYIKSNVVIENDSHENHFVECIYESENLDDIIEFTNTLIGLADANLDELIKKYTPNRHSSISSKFYKPCSKCGK